MNESEKNYAKGAWVYSRTMQSGQMMLTVSGNAQEFCEWLMSIADEQGRFRLGISPRREIVPKKPTHTMWQDTWKPGQTNGSAPRNDSASRPEPATSQQQQGAQSPDNLPF